MNKKLLALFIFILIPIYGCGNSNTKTGSTDIQLSQEGLIDQSTRDIISKEYDSKGNLLGIINFIESTIKNVKKLTFIG